RLRVRISSGPSRTMMTGSSAATSVLSIAHQCSLSLVVLDLLPAAKDRTCAHGDVLGCRGHVGNRQPHRPPALPGGASRPAGAVPLHSGDDGIGSRVITEVHEHL